MMKIKFDTRECCKLKLRKFVMAALLLNVCLLTHVEAGSKEEPAAGVAASAAGSSAPSTASVSASTGTNTATAPSRPAPQVVSAALEQWSSKQFTLLYRKETATAPGRLDPLVMSATRELEHEFLSRKYQIRQPSAEVYRAMDQGPSVIVTFAPDAGLSMIYSVYGDVRPQPGTEIGIAEVRIEARVFIGSNLLSVEQGRGQIQTRIDPALREYGERRAYEIAAKRASVEIAGHIDNALKALSTQQIQDMVADDMATSSFVVVEPPRPVAVPTTPLVPVPIIPAALAQTGPSTPPVAAEPDVPASTSVARAWLLDVGIGDYPPLGENKGDLAGPPTDVRNIRSVLNRRGFSDSNIVQLLNEQATTTAVLSSLDQLAAKVGPDDMVVFFLSSHGAPPRNFGRAGASYPVFYDFRTNKDNPNFGDLVERFSNLPAKSLVMLVDTCFSGAATELLSNQKSVVIGRNIEVKTATGAPDLSQITKSLKAGANVAIMTASRSDEVSMDLGQKVGGLFAAYLVEALRSASTTDTLQRIYERDVYNNVTSLSRQLCAKDAELGKPCEKPQQTPTFGFSGTGNLIPLAMYSE